MEKNYETLHITFNKPLTEIDKEFEEEKEMFGVRSLKEFIDGHLVKLYCYRTQNIHPVVTYHQMQA